MSEQKSKPLAEYDGEDRVVSSQELYLKLKEQPESVINVKSFIPTLDDAVDGFREGELIVISGPTKNGKTLLAQSLTIAFEKQQYYPLWFSFEIPTRQFLNQFHVLPLIYLPSKLKAHALSWFEERVYESFEKYHTRIIFIDHLHYLINLAKLRNPSIEIGQIIRKLKNLAVLGNFLIFLLCHTTKGSSEESLSFESIRDSSFISQESDSVIMIRRSPEDGENRARIRVEFHRRTGVIERIVKLIKIGGYLVEVEEQEKSLDYHEDMRRRDIYG
jgi:archaellum biogenesis ATPase FlaH